MTLENNNEDFDKGFENGLENLEKSNYEGFLSSEVSFDWLTETKQYYHEQLVETNETISKTKADTLEILKEKQTKGQIFEEQDHLVKHQENEIAFHQNRIAEIKEEKAKTHTSYPFLAGILYFVAGATFIAGDLIISHEIVAYALNIRNTFEAWAFAVGLASVSVLLKPAYERLIEQPYLNNYNEKTKKNYGYFQIILLVISISTLTILGWFRYEAYKTDKLKESINREIKSLQLENTPLVADAGAVANPVITQKIEEKLKAYDLLNQKLVDSPWALLSFVLSGVLFALAGAICLGIAFPILHVYWKRWLQLHPVRNRAQRKIRKHTKVLNEIKKPWITAKKALEYEDARLALFPNLEELSVKKQKLESDLLAINEKIKLTIESGRVSSYSDGYDSGVNNRNSMSNEEFEEYRKKLLEKVQTGRENRDEITPRTVRNNGLRPHQALRKAISEGFNEN